jgi:thiamine biosynthesis lipoprotein
MKTPVLTMLTPLSALLAVGCARANYETFNGFAQGTTYTITVKEPAPELAKKIDEVFAEIDLTFSVFNPESLTSRLNRGETREVTPLFAECFELAKKVHAATDGYFDSTVAPLVDAWGFGAGDRQEIPDVEALMRFVGMDKVRIEGGYLIKEDPRVRLDFSSVAKGLTVDLLARAIEESGSTDYMVYVGGEVRVRGVSEKGRPWRIGIDRPTFGLPKGGYETVVSFTPPLLSIATSGNYRNWSVDGAGRTRAHTIDPKTGEPALGEILSVSIVAAECAVADAWATGIMASSTVERARRLLGGAAGVTAAAGTSPTAELEYYIIYSVAPDSMAHISSADFPTAK